MAYGRFRQAGKISRARGRRHRIPTGTRYGVIRKGRFVPNRLKSRFATVGFARDVEKKYTDRAVVGNDADEQVTGVNVNDLNNGFMYASRAWNRYDFATPGTGAVVSNDMLKTVDQGTTASTRIGNKINPKYIKGAITLTAAKLANPSTGTTNGDMNGESVATPGNATTTWEFLRTTFRVVIVMDLQVNSVDTHINWNDVFENGTGAVGETGGVHSELKIANMGRFRILSDKMTTLDAKRPQDTMRFMVNGSSIGSVRYNGPTANALTDKGVYVIWSAYTGNVVNTTQAVGSGMVRPGVTMHSRLCFTDA